MSEMVLAKNGRDETRELLAGLLAALRWIPVDERKPAVGKRVFELVDAGGEQVVCIGWRMSRGLWHVDGEVGMVTDGVVAWMEIEVLTGGVIEIEREDPVRDGVEVV